MSLIRLPHRRVEVYLQGDAFSERGFLILGTRLFELYNVVKMSIEQEVVRTNARTVQLGSVFHAHRPSGVHLSASVHHFARDSISLPHSSRSNKDTQFVETLTLIHVGAHCDRSFLHSLQRAVPTPNASRGATTNQRWPTGKRKFMHSIPVLWKAPARPH
jgi:hypothetical protein